MYIVHFVWKYPSTKNRGNILCKKAELLVRKWIRRYNLALSALNALCILKCFIFIVRYGVWSLWFIMPIDMLRSRVQLWRPALYWWMSLPRKYVSTRRRMCKKKCMSLPVWKKRMFAHKILLYWVCVIFLSVFSQTYKPKSKIRRDCNQCVCARGKWVCTKNRCDGICRTYGDR